MNDDRLLSALKRLGHEELPTASDRAIRGRIETAWTARARTISISLFSIRRFAPVLAALVLVAAFGGTALGASADSPLWDTRVALEEIGALLRTSNDDRVAYLLDLVQSRTEEAARQEVLGHPDAAAKARVAASSAVFALDGNLPQIDTTVTLPLPTPTPAIASPTTAPTPTPTATPFASPTPTSTSGRTSAPPVAPSATPLRTETLRPATPSPTPAHTATPLPSTGTKQAVTITGTVRDATGATVTGACISTSPTPPTSMTSTSCFYFTKSGSYGSTVSVPPGYTITLYAYWTSPSGQNFSGSTTAALTPPTTVMPTLYLTLRK